MTKTKKKGNSTISLGTVGALVLLCVVIAVLNKNFYNASNIMSILKQTTFNAFLATGMLLCLITAGIDLSVGANAVFCACLMGALKEAGLTNGILLMLIAIVAGGVVGCVNGTLLTRLHLPHPFVSTLGMKNVLWGLGLLVTGNKMINNFPTSVQFLGKQTIGTWGGGFPVGFIVIIVLYVVMHIFLSRTALGRSIYCAGGNMEATRLSGINTANVLTFCYTLSGVMAALGGIYIIGGASFTGGKGTMIGTMLGCLIIAVLRNGFALLAIDTSVQNIVLGLVIILAVLMDVIRAQMEAKRRRLAAGK